MSNENELQLGFAEDEEAKWLTNRYFPSKLGGKPAWLELATLPSKDQLVCKKCEMPKAFICQLYAPYEEHERCFHRTIYIFMCRSKQCQEPNKADNITVLRSQLGLVNDFFSEEPPSDGPDDVPLPAIPPQVKLCYVCGCAGHSSCGSCKKINYCSIAHQRIHWPHHKHVCQNVENTAAGNDDSEILSTVIFPEYEIGLAGKKEMDQNVVEADDNDDDEAKEKERIAEYEKLLAAGKTGVLQNVSDEELNKYCANDQDPIEDENFTNFKKIVSKHPYQIVRYKRGNQPLWITTVQETITEQLENIPNCENCGGVREFEFQIMPSMLTLIKDEHIDWGVLAVYTCKSSCEINSYVPEVVIKQDI